MTMRFTAIIENRSRKEDLIAQYGLSLFLETGRGNVLLDAGSDGSAYQNFLSLGFSPDRIDAIVVSHNHNDHFGGVPFFADHCSAPIYLSREADRDYYLKRMLHRRQLVSCGEIIRDYRDRIVPVDDRLEIFPGVFLCRIAKTDPAFFCKDRRLRRMVGGRLLFDDFAHEIYLAVIEQGRCIVFSSCSHNGIVNIVRDAERRFGTPVDTFVGGLHTRGNSPHTLNCSRRYLDVVASEIGSLGVQRVLTCHCTGDKAYRLLKRASEIRWHYFSTGESFEV